jgi:hypothetical protein
VWGGRFGVIEGVEAPECADDCVLDPPLDMDFADLLLDAGLDAAFDSLLEPGAEFERWVRCASPFAISASVGTHGSDGL